MERTTCAVTIPAEQETAPAWSAAHSATVRRHRLMEKFTGSLGEEVFALLWCLTSYGTVEEFSSSTRYEFVEGTVRDTLQPYFSEKEGDLRAICEAFKAKYKSHPAACEFADELMRVLKDRHDPVELFKPLPS